MKRVFLSLFAGAIGCALALQFPLAANAREKVVYSFAGAPDGEYPNGGMIDVNGTLYGTTEFGGANCTSGAGCGTAFSLDPKTGAETVLYSFCSRKKCPDGAGPTPGLIDVNGTLYGTATLGGNTKACRVFGCGAVFSLDPKTGAETVVYSFGGSSTDGAWPHAGLIDVNGTLYGTTGAGGANCEGHDFGGCGTVFAFDPTTGTETVLYSFCAQKKGKHCPDGSEPAAGLLDVNGTLYGTTTSGGAYFQSCFGYGCGTVFALDVKTGAETVVHSFGSSGTDGTLPFAGLIDVNGTLYGTTSEGGSGWGTVFSLDPTTGVEVVLQAFCRQQKICKDGAFPFTGVVDVNGLLYGTTLNGGAYGGGVVFSLDPSTGTETVLHAFGSSGTDGIGPGGPMTVATGKLYGVTAAGGGTNDDGTVFAVKP